jgi:predicted secreted protein
MLQFDNLLVSCVLDRNLRTAAAVHVHVVMTLISLAPLLQLQLLRLLLLLTTAAAAVTSSFYYGILCNCVHPCILLESVGAVIIGALLCSNRCLSKCIYT